MSMSMILFILAAAGLGATYVAWSRRHDALIDLVAAGRHDVQRQLTRTARWLLYASICGAVLTASAMIGGVALSMGL